MASASMRKRTRTLSPTYYGDKGFDFDGSSLGRSGPGAFGRSGGGASAGGFLGGRGSASMGSEPDI